VILPYATAVAKKSAEQPMLADPKVNDQYISTQENNSPTTQFCMELLCGFVKLHANRSPLAAQKRKRPSIGLAWILAQRRFWPKIDGEIAARLIDQRYWIKY